MFDRHLQSTGGWPLDAPATALESTGDGFGILIGSGTGDQQGTIVWRRRTDGARILRRQLGSPVRSLRLDREGRRVFALGSGADAGLSVLTADRLRETHTTPACSEPVSVAFSPDGDRAYVTCQPGAVVEVDVNLQMVVRSAWVGADSGRACGVGRGDLSANGTLVYVPCAGTGWLYYLDRATLQPWDSMPLGAGAAAIVAAPRAIGVVLLPDSDRVLLVNLQRKTVVATLGIQRPADVALSADGRLAFLAAGPAGAEGALVQIDTRTGTVLGRATVPLGARAVHLWPGRREPRMYWTASPPPLEPPEP